MVVAAQATSLPRPPAPIMMRLRMVGWLLLGCGLLVVFGLIGLISRICLIGLSNLNNSRAKFAA